MRNDRERLLRVPHGTLLWTVLRQEAAGLTKKALVGLALGCLAYLVGCGGSNGSGSNNPPPTPVISVSGPASVMVGQQAQYTAAENGSPITPTWAVNNVTGGNSTVGTISAAGLYTAPQAVPNPANVTITATSSGATAGSVSVTINPPTNPTIASFAATPGTIQSGASSTLSWSTSNAVSLSINQGVCNPCTPVNQGSIVVTPTETTTYTLTATGAQGTTPATATTTVTVNQISGGPSITPPILPFMFFLRGDFDAYQPVTFTINCVGCQEGDVLTQSYLFGPLTLPSGNLNQFFLHDIYPGGYNTGLDNVQIDPPSGGTDSNIVPFANIGDQNPLAFETDDGSVFFLGDGGTAYKFNETGQLVTSFPASRWGVAVDNAVGQGSTSTDDVVVAIFGNLMDIFDKDGTSSTRMAIRRRAWLMPDGRSRSSIPARLPAGERHSPGMTDWRGEFNFLHSKRSAGLRIT